MNRSAVVFPLVCLSCAASLSPASRAQASLPASVAPHPDWRNALRPTGAPGPELTLASRGKSAYRIILPTRPTTMEEKAAADLSHWLEIMTGVVLPVGSEKGSAGGPVIAIGRTQHLTQAGLVDAAGDLGREGYGIGIKDGNLLLWGGNGRGVINAVYALLGMRAVPRLR